MTIAALQELTEKIEQLSPGRQSEVVDFVEALLKKIIPPLGPEESAKAGQVPSESTASSSLLWNSRTKPRTGDPKMYLIDTNVWIHRLMDHDKSEEVGEFLAQGSTYIANSEAS